MITIRKPLATDRAAWGALYAGYADFYRVEQSEAMRERVWGWIHDPAHEVEALVAEAGGVLVGMAHFRAFARPLAAARGGFLDDLFVASEARGSGAAEALIRAIEAEGRARGWSVIRWITAEDNARARALYDRLAQATAWVTYDLKL
ncbi:MAG: GNAT family N-acetyltransferase [Pararhodobacter sp.]